MKSDSIKTYSYRVSQASKSDLIVILYDIAMESVQDAQAAYREKNDDEYHASLKRAKRVVDELRKSFYEVSRQDTTGPVMRNAEQVYAGLTYSNMGTSTEIAENTSGNRGYTV